MNKAKQKPFETKFSDNYTPTLLEKLIQKLEVYRADVMKSLIPLEGSVLVDLACGDGDFLKSVSGGYDKLYGYDISQKRIKNAKKNLKHILDKVILEERDLDLGIPLQDNFVDVVICEASLAYFLHVDQVLREVHRVLKPEGVFVVQIGNYAFISRRIALLMGKLPKISSFTGFGDGGMIHYFTYSELRNLLMDAGFVVTAQTNSGILARFRSLWPALFASDIIIRASKK